jgi:hypothetical protein
MGVSEARCAVRRARRDQMLALAWIASASIRLRLAQRRLDLYRRLARWRGRSRRRWLRSSLRSTWLGAWLD